MNFFRCRVCEQKDLRIGDLLAQITMLRALVSPQTSASRIPLLSEEADAVVSGRDEPFIVTEEQLKEFERIDSEAQRILTGTY